MYVETKQNNYTEIICFDRTNRLTDKAETS